MRRNTLALALAFPLFACAATAAGDAAAAPLKDDPGFHFLGQELILTVAPPEVRVEEPGRPPSERHFWIHGYHRWTGREYIWNPGRWEVRREGYRWQEARWEHFERGWRFHEGLWVHL